MVGYKSTDDAGRGQVEHTPTVAIELIDVLIRGLATTKVRMEAGDPLAQGRVCIGWYVDHDHSCVLWYSNPQQ